MCDIIQFAPKLKDDPRFTALLDATLARLGEATVSLKEDLVNLAFLGPWREWSDAQPPGTGVQVSGDALADTSDGRISELYQLYEHINIIIERLRATSIVKAK